MKKVNTTAMNRLEKVQTLTIGLDLGDRWSRYRVLDENGRVLAENKTATSPTAMEAEFAAMARSRIALETGTHSPWVNRLLSKLGHEEIVAHARNVRLIGESRRKDEQAGRPDAGAASQNRPAVAMPGEAPERESAGRLVGDQGPSWTGASADGTGQHGTRTGEVLWRTAARVYRAQHAYGRLTIKSMLGSQAANRGSETSKRTNAMMACDMAELLGEDIC